MREVDKIVERADKSARCVLHNGAAVEYFDKTHGQVLVGVDVTTTTGTTGANAGTNAVDRYRARILLTKVCGRWLVSGLDQVG